MTIRDQTNNQRIQIFAILSLLCGWFCSALGAEEPGTVDVSGFRDVVKHWHDKYGRDRQDQQFTPDQVVPIADNILAFQVADGGWSKSFNPLLNVPTAELRSLLGSSLDRSTLDNRTTYTHIAYLAKSYVVTGRERFRIGAERGIDYILDTQRESGGWRGADVDAITYNDDVMVGVMRLLADIEGKVEHFRWVDDERAGRVSHGLRRAIDVTLKCQIVVDGQKTGWCQQHDHTSLAPVKARSYELPAICPVESSEVVRFLMTIDRPPPPIIASIEAAVKWIDHSKLSGVRVKEIEVEPVRFANHTTNKDRIVVADPHAPPIWTRYYEIESNRPFFCNRDGTKVYSLAEVAHERRTGYGWYSTAPSRLLEHDYPIWKANF